MGGLVARDGGFQSREVNSIEGLVERNWSLRCSSGLDASNGFRGRWMDVEGRVERAGRSL